MSTEKYTGINLYRKINFFKDYLLHNKTASLDSFQGLDPPAAAIRSPVDTQLVLSPVLHHPVDAVTLAFAQLVALIDRVPHPNSQF